MAELEKRTQTFEMMCYRRLLNISYKDQVTNEDVCRMIQTTIGKYDELLTLVKKWKLRCLWPYLKVFWLSKDDSAGHSAREEKTDRRRDGNERDGLC